MLALIGGKSNAGIGTVTGYLFKWLKSAGFEFEFHNQYDGPFIKTQGFDKILVVGNLLSILPTLLSMRLKRLSRSVRIILYLAHEGKVPSTVAALLQGADTIITPSQWNYSLLRPVYQGELRIIPHGVDTSLFQPYGHDTRVHDVAIIAPSWSAHRKGLDISSKVLAATNAKAVANRYAYFNGQMKGVSSRLNLFEHISYEMLPKFYNSAKIFLFPSRSEGFGLPVLESMSCGTPVIFSDAPAHNEFAVGVPIKLSGVYTGRKDFSPFALTYHDTNPADYILELQNLMQDSPRLRELGFKARLAAERYDYRIVFEDLKNVLS